MSLNRSRHYFSRNYTPQSVTRYEDSCAPRLCVARVRARMDGSRQRAWGWDRVSHSQRLQRYVFSDVAFGLWPFLWVYLGLVVLATAVLIWAWDHLVDRECVSAALNRPCIFYSLWGEVNIYSILCHAWLKKKKINLGIGTPCFNGSTHCTHGTNMRGFGRSCCLTMTFYMLKKWLKGTTDFNFSP